jgi:hypothetical protein
MNKIFWIAGSLLVTSASVVAQVMDHVKMDHGAAAEQPMDHATMDHNAVVASAGEALAAPREPGQSAYAALGEAVRIMVADPQTDWARADVNALRNHLVDMDNVTLRAAVATTPLANGATFRVSGEGPVVGSIQRMTRSHFAETDFGKGWKMTVQPTATGADVTVVSPNPVDATEINGLGFFGILTMGAHHQPHHLMMARGAMRH